MTNLLDAAQSAEHAQRNWTGGVRERDKKLFIDIARTMPTKQNIPTYELVVSTNKELNKFVYLNSYNPHQREDDGNISVDHGGKFFRNSQVNAPLLFIYLIYQNPKNISRYVEENRSQFYLGTGISSGAVALAANIKGYKTGFCSCVISINVVRALKDKYKVDIDPKFADRIDIMLLGIGHPNENLKHNQIIDDDGKLHEVSTYEKNIKCTEIL